MSCRTRTPAGGSTVSTVGMSDGSRGRSDWTCSPSGSETLKATRVDDPGRTCEVSMKDVIVAFGALCPYARLTAKVRRRALARMGVERMEQRRPDGSFSVHSWRVERDFLRDGPDDPTHPLAAFVPADLNRTG